MIEDPVNNKGKVFASLAIIATGEYNKFLDNLLKDIENYFLPFKQLVVVVFTDQVRPNYETEFISFVFQHVVDRGWPWMSLDRYMYMLNEPLLWDAEYVFYLDADTRIRGVVGREILGDSEKGKAQLVAVEHYGYYNSRVQDKPFDSNKQSYAYTLIRDVYYSGAFQGGESNMYRSACKVLMENIQHDKLHGVMARCHDESHWNGYLSAMREYVHCLNPYYCCYGFIKVAPRKGYWKGHFAGPLIVIVPKTDEEMGKHLDKVEKVAPPDDTPKEVDV